MPRPIEALAGQHICSVVTTPTSGFAAGWTDGRMDTLNGRNGRVGAGVTILVKMTGKLLGMASNTPIQACRDASWGSVTLRLSPNRSLTAFS